jgi:cell division FtsZ-interacting protein ZapD
MNKLSNIPDKNPFKVPDNYFEEVNRKIISATAGFDQEVRKVKIYSRFRTRLLIAASVAGFILISYTAVKILTPDNKKSQVSEVLSEMNPDSYINDIDISSLEEDASSFIAPEAGQDVSRKDIIDYLLFENIEVNDIYEQL